MKRERPPKAVMDVCAEIEGSGNNDGDCIEHAAREIVALRILVNAARDHVPADTVEGQRWHAEVARRLGTKARRS